MISSQTDDHDLFEPYAALLRQTTSRAVERLRRRREAFARSSLSDTRTEPSDHPYMNSNSSNSDNNNWVGSDRNKRFAPSSPSQPLSLRPIDILVIQYCMYYVDVTRLPEHHYLRLACEVVTGSVDRVLYPRYFTKAASLPQLCEKLAAEYTAEVMQSTLVEVESCVELRATLAAWIDKHSSSGNVDEMENENDESSSDTDFDEEDEGEKDVTKEERESDEDNNDVPVSRERLRRRHRRERQRHRRRIQSIEDEQHRAEKEKMLDLAGVLYNSLEFWVRVYDFVHALASGAAQMNRFGMHPRYERELLELLHRVATRPRRTGAVRHNAHTNTTIASREATDDIVVTWDDEDEDEAAKKKVAQTPLHGHSTHSSRSTADADKRAATEQTASPIKKEEDAYPLDDTAIDIGAQQQEEWDTNENADGANNTTAVLSAQSTAATAGAQDAAEQVVVAVLADTLALSHVTPHHPLISRHTACGGSHAVWDGISADYYVMIHARLAVMTARDRLHQFGRIACNGPQPLTESQWRVMSEKEKERQQQTLSTRAAGSGAAGTGLAGGAGLPLDFVPGDRYYAELMARQSDFVEEDEELYKDEVVDYYLRKGAAAAAVARQSRTGTSEEHGNGEVAGRRWPLTASQQHEQHQQQTLASTLVKPHRFCKVKTGFTWTQYNRTHYDSYTNPPPRTVMWYEFTLFYPALVHTRRNMRNIFHIEDTPRGPQDDYCLLVFSVGPPYADVAYRIVKKQWDTRRGGVRISFDATGKYKLFFRFSNSNYRR